MVCRSQGGREGRVPGLGANVRAHLKVDSVSFTGDCLNALNTCTVRIRVQGTGDGFGPGRKEGRGFPHGTWGVPGGYPSGGDLPGTHSGASLKDSRGASGPERGERSPGRQGGSGDEPRITRTERNEPFRERPRQIRGRLQRALGTGLLSRGG